MTLAGTYVRLELDSVVAGLPADAKYTGVRIAQSDGSAWWDHMGIACTSADVTKDPLLSNEAWQKAHRSEAARDAAVIPLDILYRLRLPDYFQFEDDRQKMGDYFRDFVYGPLRGALDAESRAARELMAEQVRLEKTLPVSLIARNVKRRCPRMSFCAASTTNRANEFRAGHAGFLSPLKKTEGQRPTRLDLARWLVNPENPLTARVTVNRFWQQLFGEGLGEDPRGFWRARRSSDSRGSAQLARR